MATSSGLVIRPIREKDDDAIAQIIRTVMPEFGASGPGFAIMDAEVDEMTESYSGPGCAYFVALLDKKVVGGAGIGPLKGGGDDTCELRKMYVLAEARGLGAGRRLMRECLIAARQKGYRHCYLETLENMTAARKLYERTGFKRIPGAMGRTGHHGCNRFYLLDLWSTSPS